MRVRTFESITEVDPASWNRLVSENCLIRRHEYLKAVEASRINDCRYSYPVVHDGADIVAHTCVYFISTELDTFAQGMLKRAISRVRTRMPNFMILRSVECGCPIALGNTVSFAPGADKAQALDLFVAEIERIARRWGVGVLLFRDFTDDELPFYDRLERFGYRRLNNLPRAVLKIQWKTFDEYLRALRRVYRRRILKQMRALDRKEISVEIVKDFAEYADCLAMLWDNVYQRAREYRRERLLADFFENMDKHLGANSNVLLIRRHGVPVAFSLLLFDDGTLTPLFCGFDYEHNAEYCLYFNTMNKAVEIAVERGMKEVDFGITTLVPKISLGAEAQKLYMYMKHLNPVMNRIIPWAFEKMTPAPALQDARTLKPAYKE